MSPRAAHAANAAVELFAPKGGFSCPAFTSLPCSLDVDLSDPHLAKTLSGVFSSETVVLYDGLELSPLTSTAEETLQRESQLRAQKHALDRSMSHEAARMDEWRGTSNVRVPGVQNVHTVSSYQSPRCGPPARSPLARVNKVGQRGWITEEARDLPCLPQPGESDGALLGRQTMQLEIADLWGKCSIEEDELPMHSPLSPAAAAIRAAEAAALERAEWQRRRQALRQQQQKQQEQQQKQQQADSGTSDSGDDGSMKTAARTEAKEASTPPGLPSQSMETDSDPANSPDAPPVKNVSRSGRVRKQNSQFADYVDPEETSPSYQPGARSAADSDSSIWDRAFSAGRRMLESTKRARVIAGRQPSAAAAAAAGGSVQGGKRQKKRRVVVRDPNKPKPKPWSEEELALFRHLLDTEGPNNWAAKAAKLGTNRTAKSLHTRWLRDEGRIVDKPRGMAAMREAEMAAQR